MGWWTFALTMSMQGLKENFEEGGWKPEVQSLTFFQDDYGLKGKDGEEDIEDEEDEEEEEDEEDEDENDEGEDEDREVEED